MMQRWRKPKLSPNARKPRKGSRDLQKRNEQGFLISSQRNKGRTVALNFPAIGHGVNTDIEPARWTCWLKNVSLRPEALRGDFADARYWQIGTRSTHGYRSTRSDCNARGMGHRDFRVRSARLDSS